MFFNDHQNKNRKKFPKFGRSQIGLTRWEADYATIFKEIGHFLVSIGNSTSSDESMGLHCLKNYKLSRFIPLRFLRGPSFLSVLGNFYVVCLDFEG